MLSLKMPKSDLAYLLKMPSGLLWEKVQSTLEDQAWIAHLEKQRGKGRDDYPVKYLWSTLLKGIVYQHRFVTAFETCDIPASSFSRFISSCIEDIDKLDALLFEHAPQGSLTALRSFEDKKLRYSYLLDIESGIPFYWHQGPIDEDPIEQALELLEKVPLHRSSFLLADPLYEALCVPLWENFNIKPIIPRASQESFKKTYRNVEYDEKARVFCYETSLVFAGFEKDRQALKYRCSAEHYGYQCAHYKSCELRKGIRIPLKADPETFTPLPRFSYRWERLFSLYEKTKELETLFLNTLPFMGKKAFFLRVGSLVYAAAHRTRNVSNLD